MTPSRRPRRRASKLRIRGLVAAGLVWILSTWDVAAQELEPRAYSPSPIGVNFIVLGAARSQGGVLIDPSVAIDDLHATVDTLTVGFGRTFALAGHQSLLVAVIPMATLDASGRIGESRESVGRAGLADPRFKLSVGLAGAPALAPAEFARTRRGAAAGVSLSVVLPIGQYDSRRLINLGTNRWSFKPEVGVSLPVRCWTFDGYAGVWLYGANDSFFPGSARRTQQPTMAFQSHVSYEIGRHAWVALDGTWYGGGASAVNGVLQDDRESNSRIGGTISIPTWARQSLKLTYSTGATTRAGTDFDAFGITWQVTVF